MSECLDTLLPRILERHPVPWHVGSLGHLTLEIRDALGRFVWVTEFYSEPENDEYERERELLALVVEAVNALAARRPNNECS